MEKVIDVKIVFDGSKTSLFELNIIYPSELKNEVVNSNLLEEMTLKIKNLAIELAQSNKNIQLKDTEIIKLNELLNKTKNQVIADPKEYENLKNEILTLKSKLEKQKENYEDKIKDKEKLILEINQLKKTLNEKSILFDKHFELIEEIKNKYKEDLLIKTNEIEKKILETQKQLNIKTNQNFKLINTLKNKEKRKTTAELMLDEQEKINTDLIEKNAKNDKIIFDQERKINELNRRINNLAAEIKSNDDTFNQRDLQLKKMINKVKTQELEIFHLNEELKLKEKAIVELQKKFKGAKELFLPPSNISYQDELKKALEIISNKEEEIKLIKELIKSNQASKHSSISRSVKNNKLPPITGSSSERTLRPIEKIIRSNDQLDVKISSRMASIGKKSNQKIVIKMLLSPIVAFAKMLNF